VSQATLGLRTGGTRGPHGNNNNNNNNNNKISHDVDPFGVGGHAKPSVAWSCVNHPVSKWVVIGQSSSMQTQRQGTRTNAAET